MGSQYEIRLSGGANHRVELLGKILAEAATIHDGKNAVPSQCYGPEARSGFCKAEVIVSEGDILNPHVRRADILLALTRESCIRYCVDLKKGGILIIDEGISISELQPGVIIHRLPLFEHAQKEFGNVLYAGFIALGVVVAISKVITLNAVEATMVSRISKGSEDAHIDAFRKGIEIAEEILETEAAD